MFKKSVEQKSKSSPLATPLQPVVDFDTSYGHYQIVDMIYDGRPARVLFSGDRQAAQSGIATDGLPDLLFDYNQRLFESLGGVLLANNTARILIIGGGMFTLPTAIAISYPKAKIDVIEIDPDLHDYARQYFDVTDNPNIRVIADDGLNFLQYNSGTQTRYDAIVFDAYTHASSEPTLATPAAALAVYQCLEPGGVLLANAIAAYYGRRAQVLITLQTNYARYFTRLALHPATNGLSLWLPQNLIFIASSAALEPITENLRYPPLINGCSGQIGLHDQAPFDLRRDLL